MSINHKLQNIYQYKDIRKAFAFLYTLCTKNLDSLADIERDEENLYQRMFMNGDMNIAFNNEWQLTFNKHFFEELHKASKNKEKASLFAIALLNKFDAMIAGYDPKGKTGKYRGRIRARISQRLNNPIYYEEFEIEEFQKRYVIVRKTTPAAKVWVPKEDDLKREKDYFTQSVSTCFLHYHEVIMWDADAASKVEINPVNKGATRTFHHSLEGIKELTIGLAPYDSGFSFDVKIYESSKPKKPFRYSSIQSPAPEKVRKKLETILNEAVKRNVDILVFPELTIDHDAYSAIKNWLSLHNEETGIKLVVAGSFHAEKSSGGYVNRSLMLDFYGNTVWEHIKKAPFILSHNDINKSPHVDKICKEFGITPGNSLIEKIQTASPLVMIDTPIGRMATLICLDYLNTIVPEILRDVSCDFFWVPAMTPSTNDFKREARDTYAKKFRVFSTVCASRSICELLGTNEKAESFIWVPMKNFNSGKAMKNKNGLITLKLEQNDNIE
ncbi:MAG: hypothetical protein HQK84_07325 [Nitrospinae bacterium]|nr:hypothetical protein [Nitrospinota bacterium]